MSAEAANPLLMSLFQPDIAAGTPAFSERFPRRTEPEIEYDEIARLASAVCRTPLSMVMLRDEEGRWHKSSGVFRMQEPAIDGSWCDRVLQHGHPLFVSDTAQEDSFQRATPGPGARRIRSFAGAPICRPDGTAAGALCTMDMVPRVLTSEQEEGLALLARQIEARMELRQHRGELQKLIAEKDRTVASMRAGEELFRAFMNASPFLSYIKDAAGRLLFYNRTFATRFGVSEYAWLGRSDDQLWGREISAAMRSEDHEIMAGSRLVEGEERIRSASGHTTAWKTYRFPCHDSAGNVLLAGVAVDVTVEAAHRTEIHRYQQELELANERLRRLSLTDALTGLSNRRAFEDRLALEISVARRRNRALSVLLLDVDFFKRVNDEWGHAAGDEVLRRLAAILRTTIRLPDMVARYGGEEFVVLLPESDTAAALGLAERLMAQIAGETWSHNPVTVSIGLASMIAELVNGNELVQQADQALYRAKRLGRNRTVIFGEEADILAPTSESNADD